MSDLRCTYCGGSLYINTEWTGSAYMQTQEPESIECDGDCDATWEPNGTLRDPAKWIRYPDLYSPASAAQPPQDAR